MPWQNLYCKREEENKKKRAVDGRGKGKDSEVAYSEGEQIED